MKCCAERIWITALSLRISRMTTALSTPRARAMPSSTKSTSAGIFARASTSSPENSRTGGSGATTRPAGRQELIDGDAGHRGDRAEVVRGNAANRAPVLHQVRPHAERARQVGLPAPLGADPSFERLHDGQNTVRLNSPSNSGNEYRRTTVAAVLGNHLKTFWDRLAWGLEKRLGRPIRQNEVAQRLKIQPSAVHYWKTAKRSPEIDRAIELALWANVCVEWLLTGRGPVHPGVNSGDQITDAVIQLLQKMSEDEKLRTLQYLAAKSLIAERPEMSVERLLDTLAPAPSPEKHRKN